MTFADSSSINYRRGSIRTQRGQFTIGQRVRVNALHLKLFPTSKLRDGVLLYFCRGTECRVHFADNKSSRQIDERFLEPIMDGISRMK